MAEEKQRSEKPFRFFYRGLYGRHRLKVIVCTLVFVALVGVAILLGAVIPRKVVDKKSEEPWKTNIRLPRIAEPLAYSIDLDVDMDAATFRGTSEMSFVMHTSTRDLVLHSYKLNISSIRVETEDGHDEMVSERFEFASFHFYIVRLERSLRQGAKYKVKSNFSGDISAASLNGFYMSTYMSSARIPEKIASTFLHPVSAREIFPCFDEPELKANFSLSISHDVDYVAIGNAEVASQTSIPSKKMKTQFAPTVKMSTYLICFALVKYAFLENSTATGVKVRVYANSVDVPHTKYALDSATALLPYFETFYKFNYPLKKLDLLAVPSAAAAMENWGLITFPRSRLVVDASTSELHKQNVLLIVSHELAHQWFGNLVTMKWWDDSWLNEGFASFISYQGGDFIDPSMRFMDKILPEMALPALSLDAYSSSHPISTSANTPDEIREIFDKITYNKGSCVVQILQGYLGDADFRKGLNMYLTRYAYGNAAQDDLWEQLRLASGKNVKAVMDTWTLQLGYPVVHVQRLNQTTVKLRQQRFSLDPPGVEPPKSPFNYLWKIPVTYRSLVSGETGLHLFSDPEGTFHVPSNSIINVDHAMFYRVSYDEQELAMITASLGRNRSLFSSSDRVGLISDAFNLVAANLLSLEKALDLTKYYAGDANYYPWQTMLDELTQIPVFAESTETGVLLRRYVSNLIVNVSSALGWIKHSSSNDDLLQARLLRVGCEVNNSNISSEGLQLFRSWMNGTLAEVSAGALEAIQYCGIRYGTSKEWELVWEKQKTSGALEQFQLQRLLAATKNASLTNRLLESSLDFNVVNRQNSPYLIAVIARSSDVARGAAWALVKRRWNDIFDQYGSQLFLLGRMLTGVLSGFSTEADLRDVETFFSVTKELGTGKQAVKESIQKIKANIAWRERHEKFLSMWLKKQQA